ncbi:protein NUCLEAR FUSION DEFECTIVE 2 [Euphorbia lathyris]|uniref:protein NUCLEAR FUSION DEFECTIVE 2 n=1 Tax=Euphorbia lathyris TaxID=212925 RepID=UPI0033134034
MSPPHFFTLLLFATYLPLILATIEGEYGSIKPSASPFESALQTLQHKINYSFENVGLLRRAMTHPSFSEENNKALSVGGVNVIDAYVAMRSLGKDIDISSKELNRRIAEVSRIETCYDDGMRLALQNAVRIASKINATSPTVVCGALRALFGAIAIDTGKSDVAGTIFWRVHTGETQNAFVFSV